MIHHKQPFTKGYLDNKVFSFGENVSFGREGDSAVYVGDNLSSSFAKCEVIPLEPGYDCYQSTACQFRLDKLQFLEVQEGKMKQISTHILKIKRSFGAK